MVKKQDEHLVLRSFYIDPDVDRHFKLMAFTAGVEKAELMRLFVNFGAKILEEESKDGKLDIDLLKKKLGRLLAEVRLENAVQAILAKESVPVTLTKESETS